MRILLILLGLLLVAGAGGAFLAIREFDASGPLATPTAVVVPHGGLAQASAALERAGVVAHGWQLRLAGLATRGQGEIHSAELEFPAASSLRQVLAVLRTGRPVEHHLTLPEGLTAAQVTAIVRSAPALAGDPPPVAEGSVLPETYSYERDTQRAALLARAERAMTRALAQAWSTRVPNLPLANPAQLLTLASIVERETGRPEERPMVAAVFLNRLRLGMKLQSDPTVIYGASGGQGALDHGLTRAELETDTPYNTYRIPGLPPGPICMPGLASLRAVAQPAITDALYFVADGTGGHAFARTESEHLRNVAHWRQVERVRAQPATASP